MKIKFKYRGAPLSEAERKELNLKAERLIDSVGIPIHVTGNEFDVLREEYEQVGYADYYLYQCSGSALNNKAEIETYKTLLEIDSELGATQTEQLFESLFLSLRTDLIKVIDSSSYLIIFEL